MIDNSISVESSRVVSMSLSLIKLVLNVHYNVQYNVPPCLTGKHALTAD